MEFFGFRYALSNLFLFKFDIRKSLHPFLKWNSASGSYNSFENLCLTVSKAVIKCCLNFIGDNEGIIKAQQELCTPVEYPMHMFYGNGISHRLTRICTDANRMFAL